jgi:hypothetical protein
MRKLVCLLLIASLVTVFGIVWHGQTEPHSGRTQQSSPDQKAVTNAPAVAPRVEADTSTVSVGENPTETASRQATDEPTRLAGGEVQRGEIDRIKIAGTNVFLLFEGEGLTQELQEAVVADLERSLSGAAQVAWSLKARPVGWRGKTITHELRGWKDIELPKAIEDFFGAGVMIDGETRVLIIQELIDAYRAAQELKEKHPVMFSRLDEFLALLSNRKQLEQRAEDVGTAPQMFYFYKQPPQRTERAYKELVGYADLRIQAPSVLDVRPLTELMQDDEADNAIFAFSAVVSDARHGNHTMKMPLGAYVDGQWRILVVPMP